MAEPTKIEIVDGPEPSDKPTEAQLAAENAEADARLIAALNGQAAPEAKPKARAAKPAAEQPTPDIEVGTEPEFDTQAAEATEEAPAEDVPAEATADEGETIEIPGIGARPLSVVKDALEALDSFDQAHQGTLERKAKLDELVAKVQQEREGFRKFREDFEVKASQFESDARAWKHIEPLLEAENWQGVADMIRQAKARSGRVPVSENPEVAALQREIAQLKAERTQRAAPVESMTPAIVSEIAKTAIEKDPGLKQVFGDDIDEAVLRLGQRITTEMKAGNISQRSTRDEAEKVVRKNLMLMRTADIAKAQKLSGVKPSLVKNKSELPPVSRTATARTPTKPLSKQIDYGADGPEADREWNEYIKSIYSETQDSTRT